MPSVQLESRMMEMEEDMFVFFKFLPGWLAEIYQPPLTLAYDISNNEVRLDEQTFSYRASLTAPHHTVEIPQT